MSDGADTLDKMLREAGACGSVVVWSPDRGYHMVPDVLLDQVRVVSTPRASKPQTEEQAKRTAEAQRRWAIAMRRSR